MPVIKPFKKYGRQISSVLVLLILASTTAAVGVPKLAHAGSPNDTNTTTTPVNGTQQQEQALTERNQAALDKAQPAPTLSTSLERENLIKKLNFTNNSNQLGYVYLLSLDGKVVANYTIKGKVSSLNSMLTTTEQLRCADPNVGNGNDKGCVTTASPDLDGSYGQNPSGIFFFTTSGAYVEWSGTYVYSSQPLGIQTPVSLTQQVN